MKKRLSVKGILHSSWKNFTESFMIWLMLFGTQFIIIFGFLACCSILLAMTHYVFVDLSWFHGILHTYSKFFTVSMISIITIFSMFFYVAFPIMYRQNALDIVFNRQVNGFDVNNRFFSYAVGMFVYWIAVALAACFFFFPGLLLAQRLRFAGWHLLDHGGNVRYAFRSSWRMTRGYTWFLVGVSMIQWIIFIFCGATLFLIIISLAINRLIDANIYKQLHMEYDKDLSLCSCES